MLAYFVVANLTAEAETQNAGGPAGVVSGRGAQGHVVAGGVGRVLLVAPAAPVLVAAPAAAVAESLT